MHFAQRTRCWASTLHPRAYTRGFPKWSCRMFQNAGTSALDIIRFKTPPSQAGHAVIVCFAGKCMLPRHGRIRRYRLPVAESNARKPHHRGKGIFPEMKILNDMGHPAHMHCSDPVAATPTLVGGIFKNAIWELEKRGPLN